MQRCIDTLTKLPSESDLRFGEIGDRLGQAVRTLGGAQDVLSELSRKLSGHELRSAREILADSLRQIVDLVNDNGGGPNILEELCRMIDLAATRLISIQRVVGEISALAINAKVEAATIQQAGVDFSVFTTEISRLRSEAEHSLGLCLASVDGLSGIIHEALNSKQRFEESRSGDLASLQGGFGGGHTRLIQRDQQSARRLAELTTRSGEIASRIDAVLGALQIKDVTSQRISHAVESLKALSSLMTAAGSSAAADDRTALTAAAACRLQAGQLAQAGEEFDKEVKSAAASLSKLAELARQLAADGENAAIGEDGDSQTSFGATITGDGERALTLLKEFGDADSEVQDAIRSVASRFEAMARDIEELNSIEVEMRIMGLNATFKCGRLGGEGRTLAIIAQELRVYSRRTGEEAQAVFKLLTDAAEMGSRLSGETSTVRVQAVQRLDAAMREAMETVNDVGRTMSETGADTRDGCHKAATFLSDTAKSMGFHQQIVTKLQDVGRELHQTADRLDPARHDPAGLQAEVTALLQQNYASASKSPMKAAFVS